MHTEAPSWNGPWFAKLLLLLVLGLPSSLCAANISGTVVDDSGAAVPQAHIEIRGGALAQPEILTCDAQGHFASADLPPGSYSLTVTSNGFQPLAQTVNLTSDALTLTLHLKIATARQEVTVVGKLSPYANADPLYQKLRTVGLGVTSPVEGATLEYDAATFLFRQGTLTYLAAVDGRVTGAIFIGEGRFTLKPVTVIDRDELRRRIKADQVEEDFTEVVFRFTGAAQRKFVAITHAHVETPARAGAVFAAWQQSVRERREVAEGLSDTLLNGEDMPNVDAEILAALYNPARPPIFQAFIRGAKHKDLRFFCNGRGGPIPSVLSPEEVALINHSPAAMDDGIWYMAHRVPEYSARSVSSLENGRYVAAQKFNLETVIGQNGHLTSVATVHFKCIFAGERVVRFQLLPNLRVSRVTGEERKDLYFIQEGRKADGSLYVILPQAMEEGSEHAVTIEYSGDKVVFQAGNGSFYVHAREAWYPNLNSFGDRAVYDLTYKVPKRYKVISVGRLDKEWMEENFAASHWTTAEPVAVAGFNYGDYRKLDIADEITHYSISGYFLPELPDMLAPFRESALSGMAPGSMTKYALEQTRAQVQLCTHYFGNTGFNHIYVTEQPDVNFGQSWPNLVYLPILAYIDSTQRWLLFGGIVNSVTAFVQEVTPHEVAHQWWGHAVGWASYHDQWLSEGFAEFSAALFLQQAMGKDWQKDYTQFWERLRRRILEKNNFGIAANDAGPLWLGERLSSPHTMEAYINVTYSKGAYVLGMLRSLMYTAQDRDQPFIDMMHDFVASHRDTPASTESFKTVAEKHITKAMNLDGNGRLDWFFNEWVYGTEVPHYQFEYQLSPGANGKTKLHMTITQSEVGPRFAMLVPVFGDFGKGWVRFGQLPVVGNSSKTYDVDIPAAPKKIAINVYKEILER